jgi:hypothetical protein
MILLVLHYHLHIQLSSLRELVYGHSNQDKKELEKGDFFYEKLT